jgi:hypothetical protein
MTLLTDERKIEPKKDINNVRDAGNLIIGLFHQHRIPARPAPTPEQQQLAELRQAFPKEAAISDQIKKIGQKGHIPDEERDARILNLLIAYKNG